MRFILTLSLSLIGFTASCAQASQNWNLRNAEGAFDPSFSRCLSNRIPKTTTYQFGHEKLYELWNFSDNQNDFKCDNREATSYVTIFKGKKTTFEFGDFIGKFQQLMTEQFLGEINDCLGRSTDKLPNIAMGRLTLHYVMGGKAYARTFDLEKLYLAGPHYFKPECRPFKAKHKVLTANEDMLSDAQKKEVYAIDADYRGFHINKILEERLRKEVIAGPYKYNAMHSESLLILDLAQRLPGFLTQLATDHRDQKIELLSLFLGVTSHRDSCGICNQVIYGFQNAAKDILKCALLTNFPGSKNITIQDAFGTVAMTYGQVRVLRGKGASIPTRMVEGNQWLKLGEHRLVRIFNPKAIELHEDPEDIEELSCPSPEPSRQKPSQQKERGEWTTVGKKNPMAVAPAPIHKKEEPVIILAPALQKLVDEHGDLPTVRMRQRTPETSTVLIKESVRAQRSQTPKAQKKNQWETVSSKHKRKKDNASDKK